MPTSTTSVRLPDELKTRLERASRRLNKGKNWIVVHAVLEFLERHEMTDLRAEARRQSILASKQQWKDAEAWERASAEAWGE